MHQLLKGLNPEQAKAVTTVNGPVLILAGAGSGKTKTLTHRLAYLIEVEKINPWNILAVTFTNKAAEEMQKRVKSILGSKVEYWPAMGTFHSICSRLLRREIEVLGGKKNFVIYNDTDTLGLIKKIMKEQDLDPKKINAYAVAAHISRAKNELITPDKYAESAHDFFTQQVAKIYPAYKNNLEKNNALDFDDLIMKTVVLLQNFPEVLKKYQQLWKYIMVDEYQDTNEAQYILIKLLAGKKLNLCVVGDDYQAIYGFRGANFQNILNFENDYPSAKVILLEQNYRSTQLILDAAQAVIDQNKHQKRKKLWTANPQGEKIQVRELANQNQEAEFIAQSITGLFTETQAANDEITYEREDVELSLLDRIMQSRTFQKQKQTREMSAEMKYKISKLDLTKYVVLYRTNAQSRVIEETFLKYNIPYKIIGGIRFYERKEIKDLLAYLKVLFNPSDWVNLDRVIQNPPRGLGLRTWQKIEQQAIKYKKDFLALAPSELPDLMEKNRLSFCAFQKEMQHILAASQQLNPSQIIDLILETTGYKKFVQDGTEEGERRWENLQELKTVTMKFNRFKGAEGLEKFLEEVSLVSDQNDKDEKTNAVQMMTVHAAKGLEFDEVYIVGMEEGLFPHSRCLLDPKELEEERRLCYVALTRAKKRAYLLYASERTIYGSSQINSPSRFLEELPKKAVEKK